MSFDRVEMMAAVAEHGQVVRVVIAAVNGSAPREVGAAMLVWKTGQSGTIGGGRLEWQAAEKARKPARKTWVDRIPLGPALGQCCGGAVTLVSEVFDEARLAELSGDLIVRRVEGGADIPLTIKMALKNARNGVPDAKLKLIDGWLMEPISTPTRPLWIFGAGHVGRALVNVLSPFPEFDITWIDTADDRFPTEIPIGVNRLVAANPADVMKYAPTDAEHLILTYSHALDLELCHQLLAHGFRSAGLIGSRSKWARFKNRLRKLGHSDAQISRICCPIGQPTLGKHPQAIAVGVASTLLSQAGMEQFKEDRVG